MIISLFGENENQRTLPTINMKMQIGESLRPIYKTIRLPLFLRQRETSAVGNVSDRGPIK